VSTTDTTDTTGTADTAAGTITDAASGAVFGALSQIRRKRIFHPRGEAYRVTVDAPGLPRLNSGDGGGVVRFSRGLGLPDPLPDILGIALRTNGQDLLMVTSGSRPGARHLLLPTRSWTALPYSTLLAYRLEDRTVMFGARMNDDRRRFTVLMAEPTAPWDEIGTVTVEHRLPDEESEALRFNPFHCGAGIEPVGPLNRLRRGAYAGSQEARL
jgi:hypothetical protein